MESVTRCRLNSRDLQGQLGLTHFLLYLERNGFSIHQRIVHPKVHRVT